MYIFTVVKVRIKQLNTFDVVFIVNPLIEIVQH